MIAETILSYAKEAGLKKRRSIRVRPGRCALTFLTVSRGSLSFRIKMVSRCGGRVRAAAPAPIRRKLMKRHCGP